MESVARYRRWFEYEKDAHAKVLASLQAVPLAARTDPAYGSTVDMFAHVFAARRMWLYRFGAVAERPQTAFPSAVSVEAVENEMQAVHALWSAYMARLDAAELSRVFEYRALDGKGFRSSVDDILAQLYGHSWYHRGQIASRLRTIGATPASTDFVLWSREAL
jgi:uncharacterized damage-inducible protein DinB